MATSVVATATSTASTITVPSSGAAAGDIAFLFDSARNNGSGNTIPTKVIPSGWTELATSSGTANGGNGFRTTISYKVLASGDLGASITGQSSNNHSKLMLVLRTDTPVSGATLDTLNWQVTAGDPALQTVTPPTTAYPLLIVGGFFVGAAGTFTVSPSGTLLTSSADGGIRYSVYDSGASSTTVDHNDNGSNWNILYSAWIKLTVSLAVTAAAANFSQTGQDAGTKAGRVVSAAAQAMTVTGQAANLTYVQSGQLAADRGVFSLTGGAANLLRGYRLAADSSQLVLPALGPELATNGAFDSGTSGWTTVGPVTLGVVGGELRVEATGTGSFPRAIQDIAVEIGKTYRISGQARKVAGGANAGVDVYTTTPVTILSSLVNTSSGTFVSFSGDIVATTTSIRLFLLIASGAVNPGDIAAFDNISVREVTELAAGTLYGRRVVGDAASFSLAGQAAGTLYGRLLPADPAGFVATGVETGLVGTQVTLAEITAPYRARLGMFPDRAVLALARPAVVCTILARLHLYDGIARLHPGVGDLTVDGEVFQGVTDPGQMRLVQFEAIEEARAGIASAVRITLTGCDLTFIRAVRADYLRLEGRQCDLLFGLWDPETQDLVAAVPFFPSGRMTSPGLRFASPGIRDFSFTVESLWSARNFAIAGTLTPADQRRRHAGDGALDLVGGTVSVRWPIDET